MILLPEPHLPGRNPRPDPALFTPFRAGLDGADAATLAQSPAFAAGFHAFAGGHYWEAHELWEPVWMALPPASAERHLLRGLIQLANAGLKGRMGRTVAASRILLLADAAVSEGFARQAVVMGIDAARVAGLRDQAAAEMAL